MPAYTRTDLKNNIWDANVDPLISSILDVNTLMNSSIREVISELDLRSTKRRIAFAPNLFEDIYDYTCPTDMKGIKVVDIVPQLPRPRTWQFELVSPEEFDRRKAFEKYLVSFRDNDFLRKIRVAVPKGTDFKDMMISPLDSLTSGGGTWTAVGDATNLRADDVNFVEGSGSIEWDIGAGATGKAGIQNVALNVFDLTDYITQGSIFTWVYIVSNLSQITNFNLEIGDDTSNYYKKTVTTDNAGNAFVLGWNLLRFDLASSTKTGSPSITSSKYAALYMNSSAAITNVSNWRFDMIKAQIGRFNDLVYYSKYGWQTAAGAYIENSTADTDLLNADTEEFDLFVLRGRMKAAKAVKDFDTYKEEQAEYELKKKMYLLSFPSDALLLTQTHYDFIKILDTERDDARIDRFFT